MSVTVTGFHRDSYDEILADLIQTANIMFGEDMDTSEQSTFGKFLRLIAYRSDIHQQTGEDVYFSGFAETATGNSLDYIARLKNITRNPASRALQRIRVFGTAGTVVPMNFIVAAGDVYFHSVDESTIASNGRIDITVECNEIGEVGNVFVGTINSIVNPVAGITSITHLSTESLGTEVETDYAFRKRIVDAQSGSGSGNLDSIRSEILKIAGVQSVYIEENSENEEVFGLPPHSFRAIVTAPTTVKDAVAEAIFRKKPVGIATSGSVTGYARDEGGELHDIHFSWSTQVQIYAKISVSLASGTDSATAIAAIKQNIVDRINTYGNAQDLTSTSLYGPVYAVSGVADVTNLQIKTASGSYSTETISIDIDEVARISAANIEVTIVE